jgi:hypothetical protein
MRDEDEYGTANTEYGMKNGFLVPTWPGLRPQPNAFGLSGESAPDTTKRDPTKYRCLFSGSVRRTRREIPVHESRKSGPARKREQGRGTGTPLTIGGCAATPVSTLFPDGVYLYRGVRDLNKTLSGKQNSTDLHCRAWEPGPFHAPAASWYKASMRGRQTSRLYRRPTISTPAAPRCR